MAKKKKKISKTTLAIFDVCFHAALVFFAVWGFVAIVKLLIELAI